MRFKLKLRNDNATPALEGFRKIIKEILMAASQKEVADAIATLGSAVAALSTEVTAAFGRLLAKIDAGNPDLQPQVDSLTALTAQVVDATNQAKVEG